MEKLIKWLFGGKLVSVRQGDVKIYAVTRLFPRWADAQTWYNIILIRDKWIGHDAYGKIIKHELVHVDQWHRHGIIGFPIRYAIGWLKAWKKYGRESAYRMNEFEVEAHVKYY